MLYWKYELILYIIYQGKFFWSFLYWTGRLTAKSDVYSFGVVLLELLSGRRAVDKSKVGIEQNLVDWAKPYLGDKRKLFRIMDTKLEGQYPQKGAYTAATLALQCLSTEAKVRPKMAEVLATLEQLENPKNAGRTSQSEQHPGAPVRKSPVRPHNSPRNLTPGASPLPSYRQSPRVRWTKSIESVNFYVLPHYVVHMGSTGICLLAQFWVILN